MKTCTTLSESLYAQAEEGKRRSELMQKAEERERRREEKERQEISSDGEKDGGMDKKEKALLATEVLANPAVDESVKQAAAEYLKKLFSIMWSSWVFCCLLYLLVLPYTLLS